MPEVIAAQRSPEWLEARKGKITASLAGAILGVDKNRGPFSAWQEIMGHKKQTVNAAMDYGARNEAKARREYEAESGNIVQETGFWLHPDFDWLGASPDGLIGANGLVEVKCLGKIPEAVPPHYDVQMRVQLACTGREWCDFFVWLDTGHWLRRVARDPMIERELITALQKWHWDHVVMDTAPPRRKPKHRRMT